jgi:hypothetical protein
MGQTFGFECGLDGDARLIGRSAELQGVIVETTVMSAAGGIVRCVSV